MRYLVRMLSRSTGREKFLRSVRAVAVAVGADVRNPKWASYGALELDVFVPSRADFEAFVAATEPLGTFEFTKDLNEAPKHRSEDDLFREARNYFNAERYWESHESLEGAWRVMEGDDKRYAQGVILVCAAFVHVQKGEEAVALGVLRRAAKQLDASSAIYHGIDTVSLRERVKRILSTGRFEVFRI